MTTDQPFSAFTPAPASPLPPSGLTGFVSRLALSSPALPRLLLSLLFLLLCALPFAPVAATPRAAGTPAQTPAELKAHDDADTAIVVLVIGDSISAEYGLPRGTGWVHLLRRKFTEHYPGSSVINASISGDTTAAGRVRLPALLNRHRPTHVIIELGANDALRGLPLKTTLHNLMTMSNDSRRAGARVLIAGMQVPPNYGIAYQKQFAGVFERAASQTQAALLPFLLTGIADLHEGKSMSFFQQDRIHPNSTAQPRIMRNVWDAMHSELLPKSAQKAEKQ